MPQREVGRNYRVTWNGDVMDKRVQRAAGRAIVAIGFEVVQFAKEEVDRITGTLGRSIHIAGVNYDGSNDFWMAKGKDQGGPGIDLQSTIGSQVTDASKVGKDRIVWVGSWIPYALVEESIRGHIYMAPALDRASSNATAKFQQAFREEGL